ncbi:MAG: DUF1801 domain-containing protein [Pseudomonadota bacterium]
MTTTSKKAAGKKTAKKKSAKKTVKKTGAVTVPTGASVKAFIDGVENETRRKDAKTALALFKKITGERPKMWGPSIIGFGQYHYKYESGREGDMLNVGFSPRKANMVMYVMGSIADNEPLMKKLGKYKTGNACLYVNKFDDIDLGVLEKLIAKSYKATLKKYPPA